ncbi:hypothetical protein [Paracidovorax anthurii]|uniref:Uncharacterized protein n=1 Tax=Paracidovorax anthurii TaxID=78229 RepID=A0A328YWM6_9BURK|nr:hypothetical protein [Paracidovorax anthurii]RAR78139.1 hypothetical protein AX018_10322 [Paracidovorax anthurii]
MLAVTTAVEPRRIPVLLGGSGLAAHPSVPHRKLPVLLRPQPCLGKCMGHPCARCRVVG